MAADLFWYPVEEKPKTATAPDVLVAFGRPNHDRGSYCQWREDGVAPQVVWEVVAPSNSYEEMLEKFDFYQRFGVEEYYVYNPRTHGLEIWLRAGEALRSVKPARGFVSPRMGVRVEASRAEPLQIFRPDGQRFLTYLELIERNEEQRVQLSEGRKRADRLAAKLRELGVDPDAV